MSTDSTRPRPLFIQSLLPTGTFPGWVVLFAATIGKCLTSPGQSPCIGVVIDGVVAELGLSRAGLSGLYCAATTASSVCLPLAGRGVDYFGVQVSVTIIALCLALACLVMSWARSPVTLLVGFFMLRFFGQGSLMLVSRTTINLWFVRLRGTVMGVAGAVVSLAMLGVFPVVLRTWVGSVGWRGAYVNLFLVEALFMAPLGFLLYREAPEKYGLAPDGDDGVAAQSIGNNGVELKEERAMLGNEGEGDQENVDEQQQLTAADSEVNWPAADALKTVTFWSFALCNLVLAACGTALYFHLTNILGERGISESGIAAVYPFSAILGIIGRVLSGRLLDTYSPNVMIGLGMAAEALAMLVAGLSGGSSSVAPVFVVFAFQSVAGALSYNSVSVAFANYFGRTNLGTIQGVCQACGVLGSALGPVPFGLAKDLAGSYVSAFLVSSAFPAALCVVVFIYGGKPAAPAGGFAGDEVASSSSPSPSSVSLELGIAEEMKSPLLSVDVDEAREEEEQAGVGDL